MLRTLRHMQEARYLIAGGSAFVLEYTAFIVLFQGLHASQYVANSLSFCVGFIVSFTLNRTWTFRQQANYKRRSHEQFGMYAALAALNLVLTNVLIGVLSKIGLDPRLGKIVVMLSVIVWTFVLFKYVIFVTTKPSSPDQK